MPEIPKTLIDEINTLKTLMRSEQPAVSLVEYEKRRRNPPFYFDKEITKKKREAVLAFLNKTNKSYDDIDKIRSFVDDFYELKQTNINLREKGELKGVLAQHEKSVKKIADELEALRKTNLSQQEVLSFKLQWLYTLKSMNQNINKGWNVKYSNFHTHNATHLAEVLDKKASGYTNSLNVENISNLDEKQKIIEAEINKLIEERKELDKFHLKLIFGKRISEDELNQKVAVRAKVHELQDSLLVLEKDFLWKRRYETELEYAEAKPVDRISISEKYIPWLNTNRALENLSLAGSYDFDNELKVIDTNPEMKALEISDSLSNLTKKIDKNIAELEGRKKDKLTDHKVVGERSVITEQSWLDYLKDKITSLANLVLKPSDREREGYEIHH